MRLGILGIDEQTLEIARGIEQSSEHQIVVIADSRHREDKLRKLAPQAIVRPWEALLEDTIDAVVVARGIDENQRADQLRTLVQAGVPLLVSHPACESMLVYYELDMIRRESECVMLPYLPATWHPAVIACADAADADDERGIGQLDQIVFERALVDRGRASVLRQFARDVDLIRKFGGELTKLHAMGPADAEAAYANLGVQMSGPGTAVARWLVGPVRQSEGALVTLVGSNGRLTLSMPNDGPWMVRRDGNPPHEQTHPNGNATAAALETLRQAIDGQPVEPTWEDAAKSVELAEAIDLSLAKGRTIELLDAQYTDISTFKGTMTSVGCGLLLVAIGLIFVVAVLQQIADKAGWGRLAEALGIWPYLLLGALGVFLLVQFVLKLAAPNDPS